MRDCVTAPLVLLAALVAACTNQEAANSAARAVADTTQPIQVSESMAEPLITMDGIAVYNSGYGSAMAYAPDGTGTLYLLTDRGPNIDWSDGGKAFPVPQFTPRIVKARIAGDTIHIDGEIVLRTADGEPLTGLPIGPGCGDTGESAYRLLTPSSATSVGSDPRGIDSEGLVAMDDGSFWISDEYGPFIVHFGADGRQIGSRLSPCPGGGLPTVYAKRIPNSGMEGLTKTPDGEWLVGLMQLPLQNPVPVVGSRLTRMLFYNIRTGATREYAYLLEDPSLEGNSEILALSATRFLVIERDDFFPGDLATPSSFKRIYEADITGASDISAQGALGATPITGGKTLEQASDAELAAAGVVPATKTLRVDLLDYGFTGNKAEGLALGPGNVLFVSSDDDFGVSVAGGKLIQKVLPATGSVDRVRVLQIQLP